MSTVADQFAETLATAGVKRIYGIVGDSLNGLTDSIRRHGKMKWLHVRHEEVAAFAAGAEAHLTGDLAVCAGSRGPGNLHLINGLFDQLKGEHTMTPTNKFTALAIGMMSFGVLIASPAFAQPAPAQTVQAQKQRTDGPDSTYCDFRIPTSRLSPDCRNTKRALDADKVR
jgi:hypothetical protein